MKYSELIAFTQNRIQDDSGDAEVMAVIKNALNHSIMVDLCNYEPQITTAMVIVVNGVGALPDDFYELVSTLPEGVYIKGLSLIGTDGTYNIVYSATPELITDTNADMPVGNKMCYTASTYACYAYYNYRKKGDIANMFLNDYNTDLNKYESKASSYDIEVVGDSYGGDA